MKPHFYNNEIIEISSCKYFPSERQKGLNFQNTTKAHVKQKKNLCTWKADIKLFHSCK